MNFIKPLLFIALSIFILNSNPLLAKEKPVKVYILSGQSNMVGIGQVSGSSLRWNHTSDTKVSVYPGAYSADKNYDKMEAISTKELPQFGGVKPTPYPDVKGTHVARGLFSVKATGTYRLKPGYGGSSYCIMTINGKEVYRKEPKSLPIYNDIVMEKGKKLPFKIIYLTNAVNSLGWIGRSDVPGTLQTLVHHDKKFTHLVDEKGQWKARDDVWYKGVVTATANKWLNIGCGANGASIGPELQFGHMMGDHHDEPVIILKTSQGNRSLGWDFLPPGSKEYTHEGVTYAGYKGNIPQWSKDKPGKAVNWYAGKQYDECIQAAKDVLANFDKNFPQFKGRGYTIAGFAWWQGHKDGGSKGHIAYYEKNLVQLIKSFRKEFKAPNAPFVVATVGFEGKNMPENYTKVAEAQLAVSGETGRHPEFKGNVKSVDTRSFWKLPEQSPRNQGFHYHGNAETYMNVGGALGKGMLELHAQTKQL